MRAQTAIYGYLSIVLPAAFLLISSARLYTFFHQRPDIWWTARGSQVPLPQSHDRAAVYVGDAELDDLVAGGRLRLQGNSIPRTVTSSDVTMRFNNWDRVRAQQIPVILIFGITAGAAGALLLVGLILTLIERHPQT